MTSYRIYLRPTPEGIADSIASKHGDPVEAIDIDTAGDRADPALYVRLGPRESITIWMEDIERIEVVHND